MSDRRTPGEVLGQIIRRHVQPDLVYLELAVIEDRVIEDEDGRMWIWDPDCSHLAGLGANYCPRCGMRLRWNND